VQWMTRNHDCMRRIRASSASWQHVHGEDAYGHGEDAYGGSVAHLHHWTKARSKRFQIGRWGSLPSQRSRCRSGQTLCRWPGRLCPPCHTPANQDTPTRQTARQRGHHVGEGVAVRGSDKPTCISFIDMQHNQDAPSCVRQLQRGHHDGEELDVGGAATSRQSCSTTTRHERCVRWHANVAITMGRGWMGGSDKPTIIMQHNHKFRHERCVRWHANVATTMRRGRRWGAATSRHATQPRCTNAASDGTPMWPSRWEGGGGREQRQADMHHNNLPDRIWQSDDGSRTLPSPSTSADMRAPTFISVDSSISTAATSGGAEAAAAAGGGASIVGSEPH
jgi:hypothetical protein